MIKSLHIQNFQSHKDTALEFDPGVNVIVGSSDSGKSAIIRAFKLVAQNKPEGDAYRSHWGGKTLITATFDNCTVERERDKENIYRLNKSEYRAIGTGIPNDIAAVINLNDINLQQQHDKPFLISNTAGEVAQHFNAIAHLEQIDDSIKKVNQWNREITASIKSKTNLIANLQEEHKKYESLDFLEAEIAVFESMQQQLISTIQQQRQLNILIENIVGIEQDIIAESVLLTVKQPMELLLKDINALNTTNEDAAALHTLIKAITQIEHEITYNTQLTSLIPDIETLQNAYGKYNELDLQITQIRDILEELNKIETYIKQNTTKVNENRALFDLEMPDICPLCNNTIKHATHNSEK